MKALNITIVAGARPNFMKVAPIIHAILKNQAIGKAISYRLVHTGQHYDAVMSGSFFEQLNIPSPHCNLESGGGSQAVQAASIMERFEMELKENTPHVVLVVGDVTSTMACTLAAVKLNVKVAHVEAGIRSFDRSMPEEVNRLVTDSISDLFYTTTRGASSQLMSEGVEKDKIVFVGNTMIDTLVSNLNKLVCPSVWHFEGVKEKGYLLLTMHRPSNVDDPEQFRQKMIAIVNGSKGMKVIFPVHPRTRKNLDQSAIGIPENIVLIDPLGYLEFMFLLKNAKGIITDSGGVTEEATFLGIPCVTLRNSTERPETCSIGTNVLIGEDDELLAQSLEKIIVGEWKQSSIPELWDGNAAVRIIDDLCVRYEL